MNQIGTQLPPPPLPSRPASLLRWVLLGFSIPFLLFYLQPIFFSAPVMQFPQTVPVLAAIGSDLRVDLHTTLGWFQNGQAPYFNSDEYSYPPLTLVLALPLLLVAPPVAFVIVTLASLGAYVLIVLWLPLRLGRTTSLSPLLMFIFITGLFAYPLQFELERGQFNLLAIGLCLLAIWIFHTHPRFRYLAYLLFIVAVQLKVYPFIFVLLLVRDWRDWRANLKRLGLLAGLNVAALFVLGPQMALTFIVMISAQINNPYVWLGNHSIRAFVTEVAGFAADHGWTWVGQYSGWAQLTLLAVVAGGLGVIIFQTYRRRPTGLNPALFLACSLAAVLIPSVSHDYTLAFLAAPVALFLDEPIAVAGPRPRLRRWVLLGLVVLFTAAYASTLFSYTNKPLIIKNNCPALIVMLLAAAALALITPTLSPRPSQSEIPAPSPVRIKNQPSLIPTPWTSDLRPPTSPIGYIIPPAFPKQYACAGYACRLAASLDAALGPRG